MERCVGPFAHPGKSGYGFFREEAAGPGQGRGLAAAGGAKFCARIAEVGFDRVFGDAHAVGDLQHLEQLDDAGQRLPLARR